MRSISCRVPFNWVLKNILGAYFDQSQKQWNSDWLHVEAGMFITRLCGFNVATGACAHAVIPLHWLLGRVCDQSAATVTIIDSSGLTAAIRASAVNPQADTRMWRKCLVLRSESALGKPLIILVSGSADGSVPPRCLFQQWVGSKTNGFNVDSRMQEADEQTEGNKKKAERRRRVGARRGGESARFMLSVDAEEC